MSEDRDDGRRMAEVPPLTTLADDWRILRDRKWDWHDQHLVVRPFVDDLLVRVREAEQQIATLTEARDFYRKDRDRADNAFVHDHEDLEAELAACRARVVVLEAEPIPCPICPPGTSRVLLMIEGEPGHENTEFICRTCETVWVEARKAASPARPQED